MATNTQRITALEAWKAAHLTGHVTTGHPATATGVHGHPHPTHPADALTEADVAKLLLVLAGSGGGTTPVPNDPPPPPPPDITPPVISGVVITITGQTTATVSWTTNEAATGIVEYGTGTGYGSQTAATSSGTSHSRNLTGLTPGQTYHYRVRSTDTAGNLALSSDRSFTTQASTTLPSAPTNLVPTGGNTQISLTWVAPASNGGSAITGYRIYRNGASLVTLGVVTTYTNTGLTNGITYSYTVAAITAVGEGPQSNAAVASANAAGDITPPVISNLAITAITTTGMTVNWTTNEAATGVVDYGANTAYGTTTSATSSGTSHSRTLSGLTPGTTYHLRVRATDTAGNLAASSDRTFTTTATVPPPPGTSITVASISALKVALANNTYTEIIVADGTYHVSTAGQRAADSLWIGSAFAGRTNPVTVRAQTTGGVTFNGGGATGFGGIRFDQGAHHQTWQGFKWTNGDASGTGVIFFGGGSTSDAPAHHITLRDVEVSGLTGANDLHGYALYVSYSYNEGPHDLTFERFNVYDPGHTLVGLQFYHDDLDSEGSPAGYKNAHDVTMTDCHVTGTVWGLVIWARTLQNLTVDGLTVSGSSSYGIRYEAGGGITLRNVVTTGSGSTGFKPTSYEPGSPFSYPTVPEWTETGVGPANITFDSCSFA